MVWQKIVAAHLDYARHHVEIIPRFEPATEPVPVGDKGDYFLQPARDGDGNLRLKANLKMPTTAEFFRLPWYFQLNNPSLEEATLWSKKTVEELAEPLFEELIDPTYVLPVGSRPYDVSPYGAFDMVMNAKELVVPGPGYPWNKAPAELNRYIDIRWMNLNTITNED